MTQGNDVHQRINAIRHELHALIVELGELEAQVQPETPEERRRRFTVIDGGRGLLGALVVPVLWSWRIRPRPATTVATAFAMGLTYAAVTAIAVPPSTHPGALPAAPYTVPHAAYTAPTPTGAADPAPTPTTSARAPKTPRGRTPGAPTLPATTAPTRAPSTPSTAPVVNLTLTAPTPSVPPAPTEIPSLPVPSPSSCLVTVGVTGVVNVCAL